MLMMLNAIERRRNKGMKKKKDRMRQCFTSFVMYLDREFQIKIYYDRIVSSNLSISDDNEMYSRCNEAFAMIDQF